MLNMKMVFKQIFMVLLTLLLADLSCTPKTKERNTSLATSIFPIYDILQNIVHDKIPLLLAIPAGANPHTFEPTPALALSIKATTHFIGIDPHFDGWIHKFSHDSKIFFVNANHRFGKNPHIWLSLPNAIQITRDLTQYLNNEFPHLAAFFTKNGALYEKKLQQLHETIAKDFSTLTNRSFVQWHPAWEYFSKDYGLKIAGTLQHGHGDNPSAQKYNALIVNTRKQKISVFVIGLNTESALADAFIKETKTQKIQLDSIGSLKSPEKNSYLKLMAFNASVLRAALANPGE